MPWWTSSYNLYTSLQDSLVPGAWCKSGTVTATTFCQKAIESAGLPLWADQDHEMQSWLKAVQPVTAPRKQLCREAGTCKMESLLKDGLGRCEQCIHIVTYIK